MHVCCAPNMSLIPISVTVFDVIPSLKAFVNKQQISLEMVSGQMFNLLIW